MANSSPVTDDESQLAYKIAKILEESRASSATHIRKLKELCALRSKSPSQQQLFSAAFFKTLTPLFTTQRRGAASLDRVVRFVSAFACASDAEFLETFVRFLLVASHANNKAARLRGCQIISEIIIRLPDDAEVSGELWDEVIESVKERVGDKVPGIRTFAVRALMRFVGDPDNTDILDLFLETLPEEQNAEVRKTIVLSLPPSTATSQAIIDRTLDVNESVRKAAYCVLANKFPLQSLSIKQRAVIIKRGLADRSASVKGECLKLLRDEWLVKCCKGNPKELLKYLDVETYESVGESVMEALLKAGLVNFHDCGSIRQYVQLESARSEGDTGNCASGIQLMEAEVALFWRTVCRHLQVEADAKGSDAAATMGTEAAVYAAEAADHNDLLEKVLPATVDDYINLIKAHINAGPSYHFTSRQLLLLGSMLDFSDATNRKVAGAFVQELLHRPLEHETDDDGNEFIIGDGINLGGERDWACAVSGLARKVHAAAGEFEEVMLKVIDELAQPCRDRTADVLQWMHCLAVTGLLLENAKSFYWLQGKAIGPDELLQSLLLPGAKHVSLDVQRVAIRCLGLYGLLEIKPSEEVVKQLRISFVKSPATVRVVACKALIDLAMWHGPQDVDRAMGLDLSSGLHDDKTDFNPMDSSDGDAYLNTQLLLDVLYAATDQNDQLSDGEENESLQEILGEGIAKILLLSDIKAGIPSSLHPLLLAKLVNLYFSGNVNDLQRLKQCLSVFFEHYPTLSAKHKKYLSKAFIPVMHSMWLGIDGHTRASPVLVSDMRKRAVQASRFMLAMMQAPLILKETRVNNDIRTTEQPEATDDSAAPSFESGEEGLAIRIAAEVAGFPMKKTSAQRSYVSALCRVLGHCHFRVSEQGAIKLMRRLLNIVANSVSSEKDIVKELKQMAEHLKAVDESPDEKLPQDEVNNILQRLEVDLNMNIEDYVSMPHTPAPRSARPTRAKKRVSHEETSSDEDASSTSVVPTVPSTRNTRTQRASKAEALAKMSATRSLYIHEDDEGGEASEVTSEDSDESEQCNKE